MTIVEWLIPAMNELHTAGVDSPQRDCLILLEDLLEKDRSWVTAHPEHTLQGPTLQKLNGQIKRRINREPLAYIRGKAWFWGRFFEVSPDVMIPRPESESFITLLKNLLHHNDSISKDRPWKPWKIVDVGTGSGCLAITAKLELSEAEVIATDIDEKALQTARQNAKNHKVDINFLQGNLLEPIPATNNQQPATIIANLPYVPDGLVTSEEINYEPKLALFSGPDGLDHYRQFWAQIKNLSERPAYILTESIENQHAEMAKLAGRAGYKLEKTETLVQQFAGSDFAA